MLDDGCGGGGTALSLAEEAGFVVGLDLDARFRDAGTRLGREKRIGNAGFVQGDATALPFRDGSFDLVFSHSVIEHVADAVAYLSECRRVLRSGGVLYLSTAPYLSFSGAHLPRLRVPVPLHILLGRRLAFRSFCFLARHAPWSLQEPKEANTFIALAEQGKEKEDDLLQSVMLRRLDAWIRDAGGVKTRYGHLSQIFVDLGARVKRGVRIAAVGSTGKSTGPHLHYEVRANGVAENPRKFILE